MCEGYEWLDWQREVEKREQMKADELKKQSAAAPAKPSKPEKQQEAPVPA